MWVVWQVERSRLEKAWWFNYLLMKLTDNCALLHCIFVFESAKKSGCLSVNEVNRQSWFPPPTVN